MVTIGDLHKEAGVDKLHLRGRKAIKRWNCTKCDKTTNNTNQVDMEPTLGTWGPNGNGWNYWHKDCGGSFDPLV